MTKSPELALEDVATDQESIESIRQLKARYFRLMDQKRWDEWVEVFTDDVFIETTHDSGPGSEITGRDNFREFLEPMLSGVITTHHGHMPEIHIVSATEATGVWAMEDHLVFPEATGMGELRGSGWYEERYECGADGRWRIASMTLNRIRVVLAGRQIFPPAG